MQYIAGCLWFAAHHWLTYSFGMQYIAGWPSHFGKNPISCSLGHFGQYCIVGWLGLSPQHSTGWPSLLTCSISLGDLAILVRIISPADQAILVNITSLDDLVYSTHCTMGCPLGSMKTALEAGLSSLIMKLTSFEKMLLKSEMTFGRHWKGMGKGLFGQVKCQ